MEVNYGIKRTASMVVLRSGQHFLLLKRKKTPNQGCYVPVGGKIDPHERPIDTALRETQEETGIALQRQQLRFGGVLAESAPNDYNWICFIYLADIEYIEPPFCDEGTLEWIHFDQLTDIPTPPTDLQIYLYLRNQVPFTLDAIYDDQLNLVEMTEEISGQLLYP
jgi:8-oxo-dGTP diphosphatase